MTRGRLGAAPICSRVALHWRAGLTVRDVTGRDDKTGETDSQLEPLHLSRLLHSLPEQITFVREAIEAKHSQKGQVDQPWT